MFCIIPKEFDSRVMHRISNIVHAYSSRGQLTACGLCVYWGASSDYYNSEKTSEITCKTCLKVIEKDSIPEIKPCGIKYTIQDNNGLFLTSSKELTGDICKAALYVNRKIATEKITETVYIDKLNTNDVYSEKELYALFKKVWRSTENNYYRWISENFIQITRQSPKFKIIEATISV